VNRYLHIWTEGFVTCIHVSMKITCTHENMNDGNESGYLLEKKNYST
jgi:hypothetical protein